MEKALVNFFYWLLIRSAESYYGESLVSVKVPSNSIKSFYWFQKVIYLEVFIFDFIAYWTLDNLFKSNWLIISIANRDEVISLALKLKTKLLKLMQFDHFYSNQDDGLL